MPLLSFTPEELLVDRQGRPYFLWDMDLDLEAFRKALQDPDPELVERLLRATNPNSRG